MDYDEEDDIYQGFGDEMWLDENPNGQRKRSADFEKKYDQLFNEVEC